MKQQCSNCAYVHSTAQKDGIDYQCRRYPPQVTFHMTKKHYHISNYYPDVRWNNWCGEFKDASQPDK